MALKLPKREVQTGGFGDPSGITTKEASADRGNVAFLGAFDLPPGEGKGNGLGGTHGAPGSVGSSGFAPGVAVPENGMSGKSKLLRGELQTSGFDVTPAEQSGPSPNPLSRTPLVTPVEVLSKPRPLYAEEARKRRVQGEVVLSVIFEASGKLRVIGVLQGLGYGLDEAARAAAEQIRFKPAEREGHPVDSSATVRVVFELAGDRNG